MLPVIFHDCHGEAIETYAAQQQAIGEEKAPVTGIVGEGPGTYNKGDGEQGGLAFHLMPCDKKMMGIEQTRDFEQEDRKVREKCFVGEGRFQRDPGIAVQQSAK